MRSPRGWIKTARRGSVYRNGRYWITKHRDQWELLERLQDDPHISYRLIGKFPTLAAAAEHYDTEVKA